MPCRCENLDKKDAEYLHKNLRICVEHFEDIMFSNDLKNHHNLLAKPTLFNIPNPTGHSGHEKKGC